MVGERKRIAQRQNDLEERVISLEAERDALRNEMTTLCNQLPEASASTASAAKATSERMKALERRIEAVEGLRNCSGGGSTPSEGPTAGRCLEAAGCAKVAANLDDMTARVLTLEERLDDWERARTAVGLETRPKIAKPEPRRRQQRQPQPNSEQKQPAAPCQQPALQQQQQHKGQRPGQQAHRPDKPAKASQKTGSAAGGATAATPGATLPGHPSQAPKAGAKKPGVSALAGASAAKSSYVQPKASTATGHIDYHTLVVDGLPPDWGADEVMQRLQKRIQQLSSLRVGFTDCTVEAHPNIAGRSSKRTTQRVRISTSAASYRALYGLRKQLGREADPEGKEEAFPALRVTLALTANGESYKRGHQDVFQHLADNKRAPSWRGTKVHVEKIAAELRQSKVSN